MNTASLEKIFKVFGDQNRLKIIKLLSKQSMRVCDLANILGITQPSVSRHLRKLKNAGLVGSRQDSYWTEYFLLAPSNKHIRVLLNYLKERIKKG